MLMNSAEPTENGVVINDDMARESGIVRHDHVVGDLTIVRYMHPDHKQAAVADASGHPASGRPWVHRYVFADPVVSPDDERRFLPAIFEILRFKADRGKRENACVRPNRCAPVDNHMREKRDPSVEGDMLADDALGPESEGKLVYFMSVHNARFRRPVFPGDRLDVYVTKQRHRGNVWKFEGRAKVGENLMAEAVFAAMILNE